MTQETCKERLQVARLDRTQPPPGAGVISKADISREHALAEMWAHYEREHDPPGLETWEDPEYGWWFFGLGSDFEWYADLQAKTGARQNPGAERKDARSAAWAWYWRRVALMRLFEQAAEFVDMVAVSLDNEAIAWPDVLTWSDEKVAGCEREVAAMIHREAEKRAHEVLRA